MSVTTEQIINIIDTCLLQQNILSTLSTRVCYNRTHHQHYRHVSVKTEQIINFFNTYLLQQITNYGTCMLKQNTSSTLSTRVCYNRIHHQHYRHVYVTTEQIINIIDRYLSTTEHIINIIDTCLLQQNKLSRLSTRVCYNRTHHYYRRVSVTTEQIINIIDTCLLQQNKL